MPGAVQPQRPRHSPHHTKCCTGSRHQGTTLTVPGTGQASRDQDDPQARCCTEPQISGPRHPPYQMLDRSTETKPPTSVPGTGQSPDIKALSSQCQVPHSPVGTKITHCARSCTNMQRSGPPTSVPGTVQALRPTWAWLMHRPDTCPPVSAP